MADDKKKPYGDVEYADPKNGKYPIDTEEHIRAAWNYINKPHNAAQLDNAGAVKARIVAAWKSKIDPDGPPSAEKSLGGGGMEKRLLVMDMVKAVNAAGTHAVHSIHVDKDSVGNDPAEAEKKVKAVGGKVDATADGSDHYAFTQNSSDKFKPGSLHHVEHKGTTMVVGELKSRKKPEADGENNVGKEKKKKGQGEQGKEGKSEELNTGNGGDGAAGDGVSHDGNDGQRGDSAKAVLLPMVKTADGKTMAKGLGDDENRICLTFRQTEEGIEPCYMFIDREHPVMCDGPAQAYMPYNSMPGFTPFLMEGGEVEEEEGEYDEEAQHLISQLVELFLGFDKEDGEKDGAKDGEDQDEEEKSCRLAMAKFARHGLRKSWPEDLVKEVATSGNHPIDQSVVTKVPAEEPGKGAKITGKKKPSETYAMGSMPLEDGDIGADDANGPMKLDGEGIEGAEGHRQNEPVGVGGRQQVDTGKKPSKGPKEYKRSVPGAELGI